MSGLGKSQEGWQEGVFVAQEGHQTCLVKEKKTSLTLRRNRADIGQDNSAAAEKERTETTDTTDGGQETRFNQRQE